MVVVVLYTDTVVMPWVAGEDSENVLFFGATCSALLGCLYRIDSFLLKVWAMALW
jgi:hypothetical protein